MTTMRTLLTFLGLGLLMLGGIYTVSTFDTQSWSSLVAGALFGVAGVVVSLYSLNFDAGGTT